MKLKTVFLMLFLGGLIILAGCGDETSSKESNYSIDEITISHVAPENTAKHVGAMAMKEKIEEITDGEIEVKVYSNSSLYNDKNEFENLVSNNVQFILPDMSKLVKYEPAFDMASLPLVFNSDEAAEDFWDGEHGQDIMRTIEKEGVKALSMWPNGFRVITNNKNAIKSPEDYKGLKIRTSSGEVLADVFDILKAGSVSIAFDEVYTALQQGTIDGQENTLSSIASANIDEVQKYLTINNFSRVDYVLLTNNTFWDSLDEKTLEVIQEGIDAGTQTARSEVQRLNEEGLEAMQERGNIEIHEFSDAEKDEFRTLFEPVYEKYKEIFGEDVVEDALNR
ncbi:TRAP transporter substrate-binding protein [Oceanobacillus alkalisoli]|uniref:TRAP transporter substrate-binding protein n=1 Tax=Oceanobacillus alkalisoli TaxID=2925113 RepID=UPI001F11D6E7|nr:DctP family TRAP transporter solute-binding subunit [Oceanobacillus alkalisoli]MCF3942611.1 DctP family TRAP transporter solute-binding subunit [Oceanobacillus alkalisoli]